MSAGRSRKNDGGKSGVSHSAKGVLDKTQMRLCVPCGKACDLCHEKDTADDPIDKELGVLINGMCPKRRWDTSYRPQADKEGIIRNPSSTCQLCTRVFDDKISIR